MSANNQPENDKLTDLIKIKLKYGKTDTNVLNKF